MSDRTRLNGLKLATAVAGCALLCAQQGAQAQQAQTTQLPETEAAPAETRPQETSASPADEGTVLLDTITVVAGRQPTTVLEVPGNVTVVREEDLQKYGIYDMQELTRYIPGVTVDRQTSATDPFNTFNGFNIRGVGGNRVLMLSDGSRIAESITDGTRDYLDFNFVRQVDVVRGPASVLWGADALGGVVAVETLDPEDLLQGRTMGGQGRLAYDTFNKYANASGAVAFRFSDTLSTMLAISRYTNSEPTLSNARADGGVYGCPRDFSAGQLPCNKFDPTHTEGIRGLAKAVWEPTNEHRFELSADLMQRNTDVDYTNGLGPQTSGDYVNDYDRFLDLSRNRYALEHTWTPESRLLDELKTVVAYAPHTYDRTGKKSGQTSGGDDFRTDDLLKYTEDFYELDIQATKTLETGPLAHELTFGFDGDYTALDYSRIDRTLNFTTGVSSETRGGGFNFANSNTTRADVYLQDVIGLFDDSLEITPGVRFATYRIEPEPDDDYQLVPGSEPRVREDTAFLKSLSALYRIDNTWSIWGKYGEGFKMPTAQQLYTSLPGTFFDLTPAPDLDPERVRSVEAGVRAQIDRGYVSVTGFYADYTDFIESFYNPPGTSEYTYRNLSSVEVWGVEMEGAYELTDTLTATGRLSWQQGVEKASADSDTVPHTLPPLTAIVGLSYVIPDYNLSFEAVTTLASPVYEVSDADSFKPGGYALLDVFGSWQFTEMASLDFGVKNVFDTRYFEASAAGRTLTPTSSVARQNPLELQTGPGRTFSASLNIKF
ncbi:TonB-dependent hemoglobin/transferrin/lactoferrin family receptor [Rhodobacterales bacterium]|nr:TonB-dependent hemoglobin/transferrin/lactoferrin family receptor [Rhodobacterales bacterium]